MSESKARRLARDLGSIGISSSGTSIHTEVATINFVGAGNTFAVHDTTVDVTIDTGVGENDSVNTTGIITASAFVGDGSGLTNLPAVTQAIAIAYSIAL